MSFGFCRDCLAPRPRQTEPVRDAERCHACGSPRLISHPELDRLTIAHIDCDAFYAAIEKRDDPGLRDKPVIVGGRKRGVVSTACYIARMNGIHSAMPMFEALKRCPEAVVVPPNMRKYSAVGRQVREMMRQVTPLVEPLSLDEAFLDLTGTERLHGRSAAETLAALVCQIETDIGITASIGLSYNKSMAKLASDLDKPRGFAVIGRAEAMEFLAPRPVSDIFGVGKAMRAKLASDGITRIGQLQERSEESLVARYGTMGRRLYAFSHGNDSRKVQPVSEAKSVSAETTFADDLADAERLETRLWPLCETVASRLKARDLAGSTVTLKLKTRDFRLLTRQQHLPQPTQLAEVIFRAGKALLSGEAKGTAYRLIGIGVSGFNEGRSGQSDLLGDDTSRLDRIERTIDAVRDRFGTKAIGRGRGLGVRKT